MKISVVILNWNRPEDTEAAVDSVLRQTHGDFEVLVWDNASSDDSVQRLRHKYRGEPRVRIVASESNFGVAGGRNRAFRQAKGDILFSLDSDAVIETTEALVIIDQTLTAEPDIGALSFEVRRPDGHLMWPFSRPAATWRERRFDTLRVDGCCFATRREIFERVGGFAEHFSPYGAEDQYFAFQVVGLGARVVYFPDIKVIHAFTPGGRQGKQLSMHIRNVLWMTLEIFPWPEGLIRALSQARHLRREALEQRQPAAFREGLRDALCGFRLARKRPISWAASRRLRQLVREDRCAGLDGA